MLSRLNQIAKTELKWPKIGALHPCSICGKPEVFRFLGHKRGKGQWEEIQPHPLTACVAARMERTYP